MRIKLGELRRIVREGLDDGPRLSTVDLRTRIFDFLTDYYQEHEDTPTAGEILDWLGDWARKERVSYDPQVARTIAQEEGRAKGTGADVDVLGTIRSLNKGGRIPLALIRPKLAALGLSREEQDKALIYLQRQDELVLYRNDNPRDITNADRDAVLYVGDAPRHMVYLTPKRQAQPSAPAAAAAPAPEVDPKLKQRKVYPGTKGGSPRARFDGKTFLAPNGTMARPGQKYGMKPGLNGKLKVSDPSWTRSQEWKPEPPKK